MALPIIFQDSVREELVQRIERISTQKRPQWGKMNAAQVLAHLNVMFELGLDENQKRPNAFVRLMLRSLVKNGVVNEQPYKKNSRTAPEMIIRNQPDFQREKQRILTYLNQLGEKGMSYFEQREHPSFGKLSASEWSNLFYKHTDHHLRQFGC